MNITNYKLTIEIELIYVIHLFCLLLIYGFLILLLLAKGYFLKDYFELLISQRIYLFINLSLPGLISYCLPESFSSAYYDFKQYLVLQEIDKCLQESKIINSEIVNAKSEIKRLCNEIQTLRESSEVSQKMLLPDRTEVEAKLNERRASIESDRIFRRNFFWTIVGSSLIFEAVVLWNTW